MNWGLIGYIAGLTIGWIVGFIAGINSDQKAFLRGEKRVSADHTHVEQWHAPLKPGDAGWWEAVK